MGKGIVCMKKRSCKQWSDQLESASPWWCYLVTNLENDFSVSQFNSSISELLQFQILLYVHSSVSYWSCCVWFCFRDLVHRQTACAAIKHMALGVYGFGCEDALIHLLNHVWPNIFETSPHLVQAFMDSIEGLRVALGPNKILQYVLQVGSTEIVVMCSEEALGVRGA